MNEGDVLPHARVLVVDDVALNRRMVIRVIKCKWSRIEEAEDGLVAVEMAQKAVAEGDPYELILMDYQMPKMNGPEAAEIMREEGHKAFIIGVTGNGLPADVEYFLSKGTDRVLIKPLKLELLDACLKELSHQKNSLKQIY
eukprot:CAMPEP_0182421366 /NCGR_PEP_ID=MMETSP1167-20130531/6728_1 /TAXON_ID=2988 /ORGANISM="Mallomonas Sp, Strain CCMP3275" /LENGTH=140 /DNA_ID=CAMNT_0024598427 /DNA_START=235 /DNA_END=657 /DNA_ORIENTATION=-